jgi:molybdenum cofactor biosynthesis protein A
MKYPKDNYGRIHDYLRISLTDRCNLNCLYCNPLNKNKNLLSRNLFLSNKEILRLINIFVSEFGFKKIRFTGGEPLVRQDIFELLEQVKRLKNIFNFEVGLTTNGTLLNNYIKRLKECDLDKLNISLDTLNKDRFRFITGKDNIESVLQGIKKAKSLNFPSLKINVVIIKNINDGELIDLVNFAIDNELNVRFIEFMPFGNNSWGKYGFVPYEEMFAKISESFDLEPVIKDKNSVAKDFKLLGYNASVSFISSISNHFCDNCNRLRIAADGKLKLCLFSSANDDINLKQLIASDTLTDQEISVLIESTLQKKALMHPGVEELIRLEKNNMLSIGG